MTTLGLVHENRVRIPTFTSYADKKITQGDLLSVASKLQQAAQSATDKIDFQDLAIQLVNAEFCTSILHKRVSIPDNFKSFSKEDWARWTLLKLRQAIFRAKRREILKSFFGLTQIPRCLRGTEGYLRVADLLFGGDMAQAYISVKDYLTEIPYKRDKRFESLSWGSCFPGSTLEFRRLRRLFSPDHFRELVREEVEYQEEYKNLPPTIKGVWGYVAFAETVTCGNMLKANQYVLALLQATFGKQAEEKKNELGWVFFPGYSWQFRELYKKFRNHWVKVTGGEAPYQEVYSELPSSLRGIWGYVALAEKLFGGNMTTTYSCVSAVLRVLYGEEGREKMRELGWKHSFPGSTTLFRKLYFRNPSFRQKY